MPTELISLTCRSGEDGVANMSIQAWFRRKAIGGTVPVTDGFKHSTTAGVLLKQRDDLVGCSTRMRRTFRLPKLPSAFANGLPGSQNICQGRYVRLPECQRM